MKDVRSRQRDWHRRLNIPKLTKFFSLSTDIFTIANDLFEALLKSV